MATHTVPPPTTFRSLRGVHAWAWATQIFFVIVVLEGAIVRATSSGAGCGKNWPLCNGQILPHHPQLATLIEFTHRSLTGICIAMFVALIAWTFRATPKGHPARAASVIAGILLVVEGALGAALVLAGYVEKNASDARVIVQGIHFTNTMLLLAATAVVTVLLGRAQNRFVTTGMRMPMLLAILSTIVAGATGSVAALADTLFPSPTLRAAFAADFAASSPLLIRMRWIHPASTILVSIFTVILIVRLAKRNYQTAALGLATNLIAQVVIGCLDVLFLAPTTIQVLHLFSADIFWILLVATGVPILMPDAFSRAGYKTHA